MRLHVEFKPSEPIYLQIMGEIKRAIVSGERQPGSKVEPVRDLACTLGVNPNTVQRAFAQLEREGLMYTERTSGRFITGDRERIRQVREDSVARTVADFVEQLRHSGLVDAEILDLVRRCLEGGLSHAE